MAAEGARIRMRSAARRKTKIAEERKEPMVGKIMGLKTLIFKLMYRWISIEDRKCERIGQEGLDTRRE